MINKFFKIINNRFSRLFKFIFFLRYLFVIFFVAMALFLIIPQFFEYKNREGFISFFLSKNYGLELKEIKDIKYNSFPTPHLEISNISANFFSSDVNLVSQRLTIYPKLLSIYNYDNFDVRKIILENNQIELSFNNLPSLIKIFKINKKLSFNNSNLNIKEDDKSIIYFKKINFSNYGYNKNIINGELFGRDFKISFRDNFSKINFDLLKTGISATLNVFEKSNSSISKGSIKAKILNSHFKSNFLFNEGSIQIKNLFFRDKLLSFDSEGLMKIKPFFKIDLNTNIKNIDVSSIKNLDLYQLIQFKEFLKRINSENKIFYKSKRFSKGIIDELEIKKSLAYGRLNITKNLLVFNSNIVCKSNSNLLEQNPIIYFNCSLKSKNKKDFYKKIKVKIKTENEPLFLDVKGSLNIFNNKINFNKIEMNGKYKALEEDLKYFKNVFEKELFDKNFINIFNILKIRKFISEIS